MLFVHQAKEASKTPNMSFNYLQDEFNLENLGPRIFIHGIVMLYYPSLKETSNQVPETLRELKKINFLKPIVVFPLKTGLNEKLSNPNFGVEFSSLKLNIQEPIFYEKLNAKKAKEVS